MDGKDMPQPVPAEAKPQSPTLEENLLRIDEEIDRLKNEYIPSTRPIDYKLGIDDITRNHGPTNAALVNGLLLEKEMYKLNLDPREASDRKSFFDIRNKYTCAEKDRLNRFGEAETDIVIPQYEFDFENRRIALGNMVAIWRDKSLDSYIAPQK